jgi:SAM-dependent methyltransferase
MTTSNNVWADEAPLYSQTRPAAPPALIEILTQMIHTPHPTLVVDLGSGTGLSTTIWSERAKRVIGIEPSDEMRSEAAQALAANPRLSNITYQAGVAHQTGLPDNSVDILTCAQSFHWMEPTSTLAEIARILHPGGVFAAYDYDWPPVVVWELERAFEEFDERFDRLMKTRGGGNRAPKWSKEGHLERIRASGHFRFTRELLLHHREEGDASRFFDLIMTNGYNFHIRQGSVIEEELKVDDLREAANRHIGFNPVPFYFSYRVRIGIK